MLVMDSTSYFIVMFFLLMGLQDQCRFKWWCNRYSMNVAQQCFTNSAILLWMVVWKNAQVFNHLFLFIIVKCSINFIKLKQCHQKILLMKIRIKYSIVFKYHYKWNMTQNLIIFELLNGCQIEYSNSITNTNWKVWYLSWFVSYKNMKK